MSTVVYQGLQSCFESQLIETTTLKLKVAAPKATELISRNLCIINNQESINKKPSNLDFGGWNFIQSLSNISSTPKEEENEKQKIPYVHPSTKTSPKLSQKSLELCTENLGSETGSDTMDISILSLDSTNPTTGKSSSTREIKSRSKVISRDFPPPLTTISNSNHLQVKPYREDGRLILKAIKTPPRKTYFQAERSNGRLTLTLINDSVSNLDDYSEITNVETEAINECGINQDNKEDDYQEGEEQEQEQEANDIIKSNEDIDGNDVDAEVVSIGSSMEKFQRPRRCNESGHGNKGLCDWKPMWVATS